MIKYIITLFLLLNVSFAEDAAKTAPFVRINKDAAGNYLSFDTLVSSYEKDGVQVDLVAAVHVGEPEYYNTLNAEFTKYDALLYELIANPGVDIKAAKSDKEENLLTYLQNSLKSILGLEFQLDLIDYKKSNFVHADMTPEDFLNSMKRKNESIWGLILKVLLNSKEMSENTSQMAPEIFMLQMLLSPNKTLALRKIVAVQFQDIDKFLEVFEGSEGTTIISERNKVAIKVLKEQIALGKKKLAIFYGAGHMPAMEKILLSEMGFKKISDRWVVAWKLS
jgi:hypothetical protein